MSENVVFLAFTNPAKIDQEAVRVGSCAGCQNKSFLLIYDNVQSYPRLSCSVCKEDIGRIGWVHDE